MEAPLIKQREKNKVRSESDFVQHRAGDGFRQLATAPLGRFLVVFDLFEPLHQAFLVALLLEAPQGLFKGLISLYANLGHLLDLPSDKIQHGRFRGPRRLGGYRLSFRQNAECVPRRNRDYSNQRHRESMRCRTCVVGRAWRVPGHRAGDGEKHPVFGLENNHRQRRDTQAVSVPRKFTALSRTPPARAFTDQREEMRGLSLIPAAPPPC